METPSPRHVGSGWITGTLSVVLAAVGLFSVLCFRYPSLLTLPEAREFYPLTVVRALLHVILVSAFLCGFVSVMLRNSKTLGLIGMGLVVVAAFLGGSRVQVGEHVDSPVYFGLDYVLIILILYSIIFIPLEKLFGRLQQQVFRYGWRVDLAYFFISTLLVQLTTYLTLRPAVGLFTWAIHPDVQSWISSQPYIIQFLEIMFLADLVQYWVHRAFHEVPWLWKFHAVHHSAKVMDWMAGNRIHIVELALTRSLIYIPAFVLGFSQGAMLAYIVFVAVHAVFIHANLGFKFGRWSQIFVTPRFHHWHHGKEAEAININYAIHFPVLDMLFGTYHLPDERWPKEYGVKNDDVPESYLKQWIYPFIPSQKKQPDEPSD